MTHNNELPETGERDGKSRRSVKRVAVLLGCALLLGVWGLSGLWHTTSNDEDDDTGSDEDYASANDEDHEYDFPTTDMSPVAHVIGGRRFVIPKAYIQHRQHRTPSRKTDYLQMGALLPDMSPYSLDNGHLFDPFHPDHLSIPFDLTHVLDGEEGLYDWLTSDIISECTTLEAGFRVCPTSFDDARILTSVNGKRKYLFECTDEHRGRPAFCNGAFPLVANVELHIIFHPRHLKDIERFVAVAFHRVCSFYRPSPVAELEYDHCQDDKYLEPSAK